MNWNLIAKVTKKIIISKILLLSLFSCSNKQDPNYFYTYTQSDPGILDPFYSTDVVSGRILCKFCNGLFKIDETGKLQKDIMESYSFNGKQLKGRIKNNIQFSSGKKLSTSDIKFSFLRIKNSSNPTSPRKWLFSNIKNIKIIDSRNFVIELKSLNATFPFLLTLPNSYIISEKDFLSSRNIIGAGPFYIKTWKSEEYILLEKNELYFDKKAEIKGIIFKIIPEDLTARFEFLNNRLDYFEIPYLSINKMNKNSVTIKNIPELSIHYIAMNNKKFPFNNPEIRRAFNMAIDRKTIMNTLFKGRFKLAKGSIPEGLGDYKSTIEPIQYNPSEAIKIFKKYNIDNKTYTLNIKSDNQVSLIAQLIQHFLTKNGIKLKIQEMEWSALKSNTIKGHFDMALFTWHADYPEAENFLTPLFHSKNHGTGGNRSFYSNKEFDRLISLAANEVNHGKRFDIYHEVEKLLLKDAPWVFLWYGDKKIALSKRVVNFTTYPTYNGMQGNEIRLKK